MSANPTNHSGWSGGHKGEPSSSFERRVGFTGKYHSALKVAAGTEVNFTGSNFNIYGAILVGNAAANATTKVVEQGGAIFDGNDLVVGTLYPISPIKIIANTGDVFVFKTNSI